MNIRQERIADCRKSGVEDLLIAHWLEVAVDRDAIPLAVDWDKYADLEEKGIFLGLTMREAGVLCGYNAFFTVPHLHYMTTVFAMNDVIYLVPEHRGLDGVRFILEAEKILRARGVKKVLYHSKEDVFFAADGRGTGHSDSLDVLDQLFELEDEYDIRFTESFGATDLTFGGLLVHLGYRKEESTFGKLLGAA